MVAGGGGRQWCVAVEAWQNALIEKILRTMPDVGKIYLLIKAQNQEAAKERLKREVISSDIFKCLQQKYGKSYQRFMLSKLVPVVGNVCESDLGLEGDIADLIAKEVEVIVNSAANTTFDERYDVSLDTNTKGAKNMVTFAKRCEEIKLLLQVSTAYVNGRRQGRIMETAFRMGDNIAREMLVFETPNIYVPALDAESEMKLALLSKGSYENNEDVSHKMKDLGLMRAKQYGWQDTYAFTKAMGEMMIEKLRGDIPVVVIRPSVIESTYREPFPGWIEGTRMMDPLILSYGKGHLPGFLYDPNGVLDVVPVDMVVNACLAAIAKHGAAGEPGINVYQTASSVVNPLVFRDLVRLFYEYFNSMPFLNSKGRPIGVEEIKCFSSMDDFLAHLQKDASKHQGLMQRKLVEHSMHLTSIYKPYTFYEGRFDNSNTEALMECMSEAEKRDFGFDVRSIDWEYYIKNVHIPGLRQHVMKERTSMPI